MLSGGASAAQVAGNAAARLLDLPAEVAAALDALAEDPAGYRSARSTPLELSRPGTVVVWISRRGRTRRSPEAP